ncbi:unnamed protein product [Moneuplotes crassus]|uniref:Protein kinase domain-containing protein n=1 Tax=Euplotes crassus TaxID=5936 RepID=A0AAD2DBC8_EUPCR|nr:unnamed protein product [Moneuplotes crassus]
MGCGNTRQVGNDVVKVEDLPVHKEKIKNKYSIVPKLVRSGIYGGVYSATSRENPSQKVSIEVINKIKNLNTKDELMSQIKKLKKLKHKNLVKYIESYENEYNIYLVMESYTGGDLSQVITKKARNGKKFSESEARKVISSILEGLKYSHSKGIIYGNIQPSDILLDSQNEVKMPGIANSNSSGSHFLSPEMKNGVNPTAASDIWSVGIILHLMLTSRYPSFTESSKVQTKLLDKVSEKAVEMIKNMLDQDQKCTIKQLLNLPWMISNLEDDPLCNDFVESDFESETTPLRKPQSQQRKEASAPMFFRNHTERKAKKQGSYETIETDKLFAETEDATSILTTTRKHDRQDEERRQRIMEEIFDDSCSFKDSEFHNNSKISDQE